METRKVRQKITPLSKDSDPTYEAWKLVYPLFYIFSLYPIPILPTRHGNSATITFLFGSTYPFRSYLRGMETGTNELNEALRSRYSDPTYEAWKL